MLHLPARHGRIISPNLTKKSEFERSQISHLEAKKSPRPSPVLTRLTYISHLDNSLPDIWHRVNLGLKRANLDLKCANLELKWAKLFWVRVVQERNVCQTSLRSLLQNKVAADFDKKFIGAVRRTCAPPVAVSICKLFFFCYAISKNNICLARVTFVLLLPPCSFRPCIMHAAGLLAFKAARHTRLKDF